MKKNKYIISFVTISIFGLMFQTVFPSVANAVSTTSEQTQAQTKTQRIQNLITRADTEINRRLISLNSIILKINALKKLTSDQKTSFLADIQNNITELTALKTKIDADTDVTTLQADVKSIISDYRIFALYVPKIHILAATEISIQTATNLNALITKLQSKIDTYEKAGKDTTTLQTEITDMRTKINIATAQAQSTANAVIQLNPAGYPENNSELQTAQQTLKTIKTDLQTARTDAQNIINDLKNLQKK